MPQAAQPIPAVIHEPLLNGEPPRERHPNETKILPAISYPMPTSLEDLFSRARGSAAGFHAVSEALTCIRKSYLKGQGVVRKGSGELLDDDGKINKRSFGTLIHALLAVRVVYGQQPAEQLLLIPNGTPTPDFGPVGCGLGLDDLGKALTIVKMYDLEYPFPIEPFTYLGIEAEVATDIGDGYGGSCLRTAIFDGVVKRFDQPGVVWSLEKKTASRAGSSVMDQYMPQFATQCVIWNANPSLVRAYGPMAGVIPDVIVKTTVPKCERHLPRYISRFMQHMTMGYLRLPDEIRYRNNPAHEAFAPPPMLHACWGKYEPCEYIGLCWENLQGDYEVKERA